MADYKPLIEKLNKKGFHASFFETGAQGKAYVLSLIENAKTIGVGGSQTLKELGIIDAIEKSGKQVYSRALESAKEHPDMDAMRKNAMFSDVYLTSTNAHTEEGDLINIDGVGNRVAAMFFGPKDVIVVCGTNKIVRGPHDAIRRIKQAASPKNTKRLGYDTPCMRTGKCNEKECTPPARICNITVRLQYPPSSGVKIHIVLIDEELGF